MPFITKLDFSNRQVKQREEVFTNLSGGTTFGVPYYSLPVGPDLNTIVHDGSFSGGTGTFTGTTVSTTFIWSNPILILGENNLPVLTPETSGSTLNGFYSYPIATGITSEGYTYNSQYSGLTYSVYISNFVDNGGGIYSGDCLVYTGFTFISGSIAYTGNTIWVDVSGYTRTNDLIVTNGGNIGDVLTKVDSQGRAIWQPSSGGTGGTIQTLSISGNSLSISSGNTVLLPTGNTVFDYGSGGITSVKQINSAGSDANGSYSMAIGGANSLIGDGSFVGGASNSITGTTTFVYGSSNVSYLGTSNTYVLGQSNINDAVNTDSINTNKWIFGNSIDLTNYANIKGSPTVLVNDLLITTFSDGFGGTVGYNSNGKLTATPISDITLKENIIPLVSSLDKILLLNPVSYNFVPEAIMGNSINFGLIAQEVEEIIPEIIRTRSDGKKGIEYIQLVPHIIKAIQEIVNNGLSIEHLMVRSYTPTSSTDTQGEIGEITIDDDYIYMKTNNGWKRTALESF